MSFNNENLNLKTQRITRFIAIISLMILILIFVPFSGTAQPHGDADMEGTEVIVVNEHEIFLIQDPNSSNEVFYEEHMVFKNTGSENYSGRIYTWAPEYLEKPYKPVITTNGTELETDKLQPALNINFLFLNLSEDEISIKPNETLKVVFRFNLNYISTDKFTFYRIFLYNNENVIIIVKTNKKFQVEGEGGLELYYEATQETYANKLHGAYTRTFGESISILFSDKSQDSDQNGDEKDSDKNSSNFLYILIIVIAICLVCVIYLRYRAREKSVQIQKTAQTKRKSSKITTTPSKKRRIHKDQKLKKSSIKKARPEKPEPESADKLRKKLIQEKKKNLKTTDRLKKDYKEGLITKEIYDKLRLEYKQKLKIINKKIGQFDKSEKPTIEKLDKIERTKQNKELEKLLAKKEKILKAIKKLESDKDAGVLDDELFEEMASAYKKQAIEILKKIDQMRENS